MSDRNNGSNKEVTSVTGKASERQLMVQWCCDLSSRNREALGFTQLITCMVPTSTWGDQSQHAKYCHRQLIFNQDGTERAPGWQDYQKARRLEMARFHFSIKLNFKRHPGCHTSRALRRRSEDLSPAERTFRDCRSSGRPLPMDLCFQRRLCHF